MEKPNYYSVTPAEVRYDESLSASEKLFYGEISALAQKEGYCWASSSYFEELYKVSRRTIYNWTNNLEKSGYIKIQYVKGKNGNLEGRKIFLTPGKFISQAPEKKTSQAPEKKTSRKQTSIKKTSNNNSASADAGSEFNSIPNMTAIQEIESQNKWSKILDIWKSTESSPVLKQAYKKFKALGTEHQQEMVSYLQSLSKDKAYFLSRLWMSTFLKQGMFHPGIIDKDLEKFLNIEKQNKQKYEKPGRENTGHNYAGYDENGDPINGY